MGNGNLTSVVWGMYHRFLILDPSSVRRRGGRERADLATNKQSNNQQMVNKNSTQIASVFTEDL